MLSRLFGSSRGTSTLSLAEGAARAFKEARRDGLPLARIAEHHPMGAEPFFADSLLRLGAVFGCPDGQSAQVKLLREKIAAGALSGDIVSSDSEPRIADLRVLPSELKRYLAWARTVQ